jgi:hypothetical protein
MQVTSVKVRSNMLAKTNKASTLVGTSIQLTELTRTSSICPTLRRRFVIVVETLKRILQRWDDRLRYKNLPVLLPKLFPEDFTTGHLIRKGQ